MLSATPWSPYVGNFTVILTDWPLPLPLEGLEQRGGCCYSAENAAFHLNGLQGVLTQFWSCCCCGVFNHNAVESTVVGFAHSGRDANICRNSDQNKISKALKTKDMLKIRMSKGASTWFVDDEFAWSRLQLRNHIMSMLVSDKKPP